jgi:GAF domain/AMIN domain
MSSGARRERAFEALLACAFLKQQIDLRRQVAMDERRPRTQAERQQPVWGRGMDGVLALLTERTLAITDASGAALALAEPSGVVCRASSGNAPPIGSTVDLQSGFSGLAILTGELLLCNDTQSDARVDAASCAALGIRSLLALPLVRPNHAAIGLLQVFSDQPDAFGEREVNIVKMLGGFALEAVQTNLPSYPAPPEMSRTVATQVIPLPEAPPKARAPEKPEAITTEAADAWSEIEPNILAAPDEEEEPEAEWRKYVPLAIAILFIAVIVAGALLWRHFHNAANPSVPVSEQQARNQVAPTTASLETVAAATPSTGAAVDAQSPAANTAPATDLAKVTDLRHWSTPQSSTVVIELQAPERIYFDVQDSQLAPELRDKTFQIGDGIVQRIRVASPQNGVSRVVLDTLGQREFSTSISTQPYRIIVEVKK